MDIKVNKYKNKYFHELQYVTFSVVNLFLWQYCGITFDLWIYLLYGCTGASSLKAPPISCYLLESRSCEIYCKWLTCTNGTYFNQFGSNHLILRYFMSYYLDSPFYDNYLSSFCWVDFQIPTFIHFVWYVAEKIAVLES